MKYKIKQLNDTDAVVISDEEENYTDMFTYYVDTQLNTLEYEGDSDNYINPYWKKIIATISPYKIEGLPMIKLPNPAYDWFASKSYLEQHSLSDKYFESRNPSLLTNEQVTEMYKLELPNQEEDVEKLAEKWFLINNYNQDDLIYSHHIPNAITNKNLWIAGHKSAQKQYSEEDMRKAIEMAREVSGMEAVVKLLQNEYLSTEDFQYTEEEIVQSLQKKQFPIAVELTEDFKVIKWIFK